MSNIKIRWQKLDNHGTVRATYLSKDGKFYVPKEVGTVWGDIREATKRCNVGQFDTESIGGCYLIGGEYYVVEGCFSRVFKPLTQVLKAHASRRAFLGSARRGCLQIRAELLKDTELA